MNPESEFRTYMKAVSSTSDAASRHLSAEEMITFYLEQTPEQEREAVRAHLAHCSECLQLWRDARDFCAPPQTFAPEEADNHPVDEAEASEFELRREWKELWGRIQTDPPIAATGLPVIAPGDTLPSQPAPRILQFKQALAAGVALTLGLGMVTLFWQRERQERLEAQQVIAQLQIRQREQQEMLARLNRLEQSGQAQPHIEELLHQEQVKTHELETRLAQLNQPQTNSLFYDLQLPGSKTQRGVTQQSNPAPEINIPASVQTWVLKITPDNPEEFTDYALKVSDRQNVLKWEESRLKPDQSQNLVVTFRSVFLSKGRYKLRIYGRKGTEQTLIESYDLKLN